MRRGLLGLAVIVTAMIGALLVYNARPRSIPTPSLPSVTPSPVVTPTVEEAEPRVTEQVARPVPAFPGAEGFGAQSVGGRGGKVIAVTNLDDRGPGSLRACAEAEGPRTCIFRVAGTIELESRINIWNPYITIAGQTAPGGGITLKNGPSNRQAPLGVLTHDVIIRYLRFRPGPSPEASSNIDAITIVHEEDRDHPSEGVFNVIVDHSSFSWATDELVNTWKDVRDVTIQWSLMSEALYCSNHPDGCMGKGMLIGSAGAHSVTVHHNLFAHNWGRNPFLQTAGLVDVVNNVIFIPAQVAIVVDGQHAVDEDGGVPINLVGNNVIAPNGDDLVYGVRVTSGGVTLYLDGNIGPYRTGPTEDELAFVSPNNEDARVITETRHDAPLVATTSAAEAFDRVLEEVGATRGLAANGEFFWRRDAVDERVVREVRQNETRLVDDPDEVGGWPRLDSGTPYTDGDGDGMADEWERLYFDDLSRGSPDDSGSDFDGDGYTDLEEFLNGTDPLAVTGD